MAGARQSFLPWQTPEIESEWAGMRPITADGLPILDRAGDLENTYIATGYSMQGVTLAPTSGQALAEMITTGRRPLLLEPFRLDRFRRMPLPRPMRRAAARSRHDSMRRRLRVAIIGSGNIGTDLMIKVERSPALELVGVAGIDPESDGPRAGPASSGSPPPTPALAALLDLVDGHRPGVRRDLGARARRARPAAGRARDPQRRPDARRRSARPSCPPVNLHEHLDAPDVNLITCGAQATIPIVAALSGVARRPLRRDRLDRRVAVRRAGHAARTSTSSRSRRRAALETLGGADEGKAIIILNPAEPPIMMRNTVYAEVDEPDRRRRRGGDRDAVAGVADVRARLPADDRAADRRRPGRRSWSRSRAPATTCRAYAGNLDIMTSAAVRVAELYAGAPGMTESAVRFVDTTLRDGSHAIAHQYRVEQVRTIAEALDRAGVWAIAVGHGDGLGASSIQYGRPLHSDAELLAAAAERHGTGADRDRDPARDRHEARPGGGPRRRRDAWRGSRPSAPRPTSASSTWGSRASSAWSRTAT